MLKLGLRGHRYSGYTSGVGDEVPSFESLITSGVNAGSVARSFFGLPNWLRDIARVGLPNCFVLDMVNAHPHIQHRRHPDLAALREYVRQREATLRSIPGERDDAKQLFIRLVYKGHWRKWCQDTGVSPGALPEIVERFRVEQEEISRRGQEANQEILRVLQAEDPGRAVEVLQCVLNTAEERRVMDKVEEALCV